LDILDAAGALASYNVVVTGVAANDGTESNHGIVGTRCGGVGLGQEWELKGSWSPRNRDIGFGYASFLERIESGRKEPSCDATVELATGKSNAETLALVGTVEDFTSTR
jgi:hypothetical protein